MTTDMKPCKRNVVGLEESDEPGSENGTQGPGADQLQGLRKRQRSPEDSSSLRQHSKKAHHTDQAAAAGAGSDAAGDTVAGAMEQPAAEEAARPAAALPSKEGLKQRLSPAEQHLDSGDDQPTPFAAAAPAATASACPDQGHAAEAAGSDTAAAAADPAGSGVTPSASGDASGAAHQSGAVRNSNRQPGMKRADTLSSQPSASSSKAKKGGLKSLTAQQAKDVVQAAWGASQFSDHMGAGYERKPAVKNPANIPQAEEAIGWGVWVAFENDDSLQWFRGVIVDYYKTSKKPIYQVAFEDGTTDKPPVADVEADIAKGEFLFCLPPGGARPSAGGEIQQQQQQQEAKEGQDEKSALAGCAAGSAAAAGAITLPQAPASMSGKGQIKGQKKAAQQQQQQQPAGAAADPGDILAGGAVEHSAPGAGRTAGGGGGPAMTHKKPAVKQQQRKQQQQQQRAVPARAETPTSPKGLAAATGVKMESEDFSQLSDRAAQVARCLQQLRSGEELMFQGLQQQQQALHELAGATVDVNAFREVREYSSDILRPLHREKCKSKAEDVQRVLHQLTELADKVRALASKGPGAAAAAAAAGGSSSSQQQQRPLSAEDRSRQQQQQQKRAVTPGAAVKAEGGRAITPGVKTGQQQQQQRAGDGAAAAAAVKQAQQALAKVQAEKAAADKVVMETKAAAHAEAEARVAAEAAAAAANEKAAELETFVERTRTLVGPIEPSGDAVRDKAVALLVTVMYPPVAVSPFKAAADLERLLAEKHGNVGAGRLMYLKHLYMIWCVLGGRELAAAAEAAAEAERAEEEAAAAAAAQQAGQQQEGGHHLTVAAQRKQQAAEAAIARAQQVLEGAVGVADAVAVRAALLDGQVTVQDVFDMTCSKLGFDQQRDK